MVMASPMQHPGTWMDSTYVTNLMTALSVFQKKFKKKKKPNSATIYRTTLTIRSIVRAYLNFNQVNKADVNIYEPLIWNLQHSGTISYGTYNI